MKKKQKIKNSYKSKKNKSGVKPFSKKEKFFISISMLFCLFLPFVLLLISSEKLEIAEQVELTKAQLVKENTKSHELSIQINSTTQRVSPQ